MRPSPEASGPLDALRTVLRWLLRLIFAPLCLLLGASGGALGGIYYNFSQNLPNVSTLKRYAPVEATEIYYWDPKSKSQQLLMKLFDEENRHVIPLEQVPPIVRDAVIAAEDARFFEHKGLDWLGLARAAKANFEHKAAIQGGSSITQQIVKNTLLTAERTPQRKLAEAWLALKVEQTFSKPQILELYLNQVYWGHNAYGIEAAAQTYFGKPARRLNLSEGALLAGILTGPEIYSPYRNLERAQHRRYLVLQRMRQLGYLSPREYEQALNTPVKPVGIKRATMRYPYFTSYVIHLLKQRASDSTDYEFGKAFKRGLKVYTTLNPRWQEQAEQALKAHLKQLRRANVQQAALVTVEPDTGLIRAMVGGRNYSESQFNRAWQAQRQPGSAFKPFVYLTAFARGYTPGHVEVDEPIQYRVGTQLWKPKNYGGGFSGAMTLQRALETSDNIIAVKLGDQVGNNNVADTAQKLGIRSDLRSVLSLPLGPSEVTPLEMATAYSSMVRGGRFLESTPILRIEDRDGNILIDNSNRQAEPVYSESASQQLIKVMKGVVLRGTAPAANIGRPVAGKTGTTSDHRDAWFVGFSPQLCTAVWIGNDTPTPMYGGATGGTLAATLWARFMRPAHQGLPVRDFKGAAAGFPAVVARLNGSADDDAPRRYERLNQRQDKPSATVNPDEMPANLDDSLAQSLPDPGAAGGDSNSNLSRLRPETGVRTPVLESPGQTRPPTARKNTRVLQDLDQLIQELEKMDPAP